MTSQRYVSKELTHFIGRGQSEEDQYTLLVEILRSGWLTHPPHNPDISGNLQVNTSALLAEMYNAQVVCFADIPIQDLSIHMSKYTLFGLSFLKTFLIEKGANPVFYVAENSYVYSPRSSSPGPDSVTRKDHFEKMVREWLDLSPQIMSNTWQQNSSLKPLRQRWFDLDMFINFHFFSFAKYFDAARADEEPDNFYMEREWRVLGNVGFELKDVYRIILPRHYSERLRTDLPTYVGQVTFPET